MAAVPADMHITAVIQDANGFRANATLRSSTTDLSTTAATVASIYGTAQTYFSKLAQATNAKIVQESFGWTYNFAQEPSSEPSAHYPMVVQKALIRGRDGVLGVNRLEIPAPVDSLFITAGQDAYIVVSPTSTALTALLTAASAFVGITGGGPFTLFDGGQYVSVKPRRRRVVQGA